MKSTFRLWRWLGLIFVLSFGALGYLGWQIHLEAPPIPSAVVTTDGETLFTGEDVMRGQQVWLASGGQQQGSVWGHGSYVAPDWSADWLHREAVAYREVIGQQRHGLPYGELSASQRGAIDAQLKEEFRKNTYDAASGVITVSRERAQAIKQTAAHYSALFGNDERFATLREQYAMQADSLPVAADRCSPPTLPAKQRW